MPRDYDPDFDDTPPPSPKNGPPPSLARAILFRLRRSRGLILALGAFLTFWYFLAHHRGPLTKPKHLPSLSYKDVDWRQFAYAQYAADGQCLCSAVMQFDALERYGSKAKKILVYPEDMDTEVLNNRDRDSQLLLLARDTYKALLIPIPRWTVQGTTLHSSDPMYSEPSKTKPTSTFELVSRLQLHEARSLARRSSLGS